MREKINVRDAPGQLRQKGWTVAVHNDYKQGGKLMTFWLFTKGNRCVKGEGSTDIEALGEVFDEIDKLEKEEAESTQLYRRVAELECVLRPITDEVARIYVDDPQRVANVWILPDPVLQDAVKLMQSQMTTGHVTMLTVRVHQLEEALRPFARAAEEVDRSDGGWDDRARQRNSWFFDDAIVKAAGRVLRNR